jgi:hypothetical protein
MMETVLLWWHFATLSLTLVVMQMTRLLIFNGLEETEHMLVIFFKQALLM